MPARVISKLERAAQEGLGRLDLVGSVRARAHRVHSDHHAIPDPHSFDAACRLPMASRVSLTNCSLLVVADCLGSSASSLALGLTGKR
jgi:hypothetical protein